MGPREAAEEAEVWSGSYVSGWGDGDIVCLEVRQTQIQIPAEGLCKLLKYLSPTAKIKTGLCY